jgi:hypothetical protein
MFTLPEAVAPETPKIELKINLPSGGFFSDLPDQFEYD